MGNKKGETASIAKITRPSVSGVLDRKRLFRLLDLGLKKPAVWVGSPAGSGKTTLINSYLKSRGLPSIWYQADAGDADIATFFYYMGLAAKKANPSKRKPMPLLTPEYMLGIPTFTLRYFEELYSRLRPPYVIVIDNYQDVPEGSPFHEVIQTGINALPEGITVMLVSRTETPKEFARLRANSMMESIGWNNLRLTENESREVARLHKKKELSQKAIKEYYRQTDGWVAGLVLLLEKAVEAGHEHIEGRAPHEVFDYFASEVFDKSDNKTREFLKRTSLLPFITPVMAEGLTGARESAKILEGLARNNFFTVRRKDRELSYQYHPLFREFLKDKAKDTIPAEEFVGLEARAGALLEEAGYAEDAAGLFIDAGQWEGLIGLIMKQAMPMVMQGRSNVLEQWLKSIPAEIFQNVPWLQYWMGLCRLPFNPAEAEGYFKEAFDKFNAQNDPAGVFLSWSGVVDSIFFKLETFIEMDPWIDMIDGLIERFGSFPSVQIGERVTTSMYLALVMKQPNHPGFDRWQKSALKLVDQSTDVNLKALILTYYSYYCLIIGDSPKAVMALERLQELARAKDAMPFMRINVKHAETLHYRLNCSIEGDYEEFSRLCLNAAEDGLKLARWTGIHVFDHMMMGQASWSALSMHNFADAEKHIEMMKALQEHVRAWDNNFYYAIKAYEAMQKGNLPLASEYANRSLEIAVDIGAPQSAFMNHMLCACTAHETGEHEKAEVHLSETRRFVRILGSLYCEYSTLLAEAAIAFGRGKDEDGLSCLSKAMAIGKEQGYFTSVMWRQGVMAGLCQRALEEGIETEYVRKLIQVRKLMPDEPPIHIEDWPWRLKMYTLARFEVIKDDGPLRFTGKAPQRPLEMLKALIALGGRNISQERLSDVLWPDADGDAAQKSFATTLFRLRRLLGIDKALSYGEGRLTLNDRYCWVDAWAFLRVSGQADAEWNSRPERAARLSEKAVAMYFGMFLSSDVEKPWALSMRERLRSRYLRNVERLGRHLEGKDQWERAVEFYRKGIETDNLAEEFYQRLMLCHHKLGQRAEALRVYDRCRETLGAVLGVSLSEETEALMKKIKAQISK